LALVNEEIEKVYQNLMKKKKYDVNANGIVRIYSTNSLEPYKGKTIYQFTCPGKRANYDLKVLSGGEKTLAIVSMVIAFSKIKKPAFIIFDEIDAFLDSNNAEILSQVFIEECKNRQIIVVSHKLQLYTGSNALVGVYYSDFNESSIQVSVNLDEIEF